MKKQVRLFAFAGCTVAAALLATVPVAAQAGGFHLTEQSVTSLGRAHSGGAADLDDASAVWYNPAALTKVKKRSFIIGGSVIRLGADFTKTTATDAIGQPLSGNEGGKVGKLGGVPTIYYSQPLNDKTTFGIGLNAPFGLATDYDATSIFRYQAVYTNVAVINLNPSVGYQVNDVFSIGLGLDIQRMEVKLTNAIDFGAVCFGEVDPITCSALGLTPQGADGFASVTGSSTDYGWNIGALLDYGDTKVGFSYRSSISHGLSGSATFKSVPSVFSALGVFQDGGITANFDTPEIMHLSVVHRFNPEWKASADISYVTWSKFKELRINFDNPAQPDSVQPENWRDVMRYSIGADYTYSPTWTFRGGLAYDQTPIRNLYRDARLPGDNRRWIAVGASWHVSDASTWDFGYAHLFLGSDIPLTEPVPGSTNAGLYNISGTYKADADIFGIQFRYSF